MVEVMPVMAEVAKAVEVMAGVAKAVEVMPVMAEVAKAAVAVKAQAMLLVVQRGVMVAKARRWRPT